MEEIQKKVSKPLPLLYRASSGSAVKWDEFIKSPNHATGASQGLLAHHKVIQKHTYLAGSYEACYQHKNLYPKLPAPMLPQIGTLGFMDELIPDSEVKGLTAEQQRTDRDFLCCLARKDILGMETVVCFLLFKHGQNCEPVGSAAISIPP